MKAFSDQLIQYQSSLVGLAIQFTKNEESAKDLVQDTFIRALTHKENFSTGTNLWAWLSTIMRNLFINSYRKKIRRKTDSYDLDSLDYLDNSSVSNDGPIRLELNEVEETIDQMDEKYRNAIYMLAEGYSYQEMSDTLNAPIGTIKSRVFYGRGILNKKNRGKKSRI